MPTALPRLALVVFAVAACGKGADRNPRAGEPGTEAGVAAPLSLPALGVDRLGRFNFIYDSGRPAYDKAEAAGKKQDWAEVRRQTEAAIARDVHHYDAHRLLAVALAQTGEHAAAVDHLVTALAADFHGYASAYASDPLLA